MTAYQISRIDLVARMAQSASLRCFRSRTVLSRIFSASGSLIRYSQLIQKTSRKSDQSITASVYALIDLTTLIRRE